LVTLAPATAADVDDFVALATEMDVFYGGVRPDPPQQRAAEISAVVLFGVPPAAFALLLARDDTEKLVGFAAYGSNEQAKAFYAALGAKPLPLKIFYRARAMSSAAERSE
jgi:hypothetical protein